MLLLLFIKKFCAFYAQENVRTIYLSVQRDKLLANRVVSPDRPKCMEAHAAVSRRWTICNAIFLNVVAAFTHGCSLARERMKESADSGEKCMRDASRVDEEGGPRCGWRERGRSVSQLLLRFIYRQGHDTAVSSLFSMISTRLNGSPVLFSRLFRRASTTRPAFRRQSAIAVPHLATIT